MEEFVASTIRLSIPIALVGIASLFAVRAGIFHLGIEGLMLAGAFAAVGVAHQTGSVILAIIDDFGGLVVDLLASHGETQSRCRHRRARYHRFLSRRHGLLLERHFRSERSAGLTGPATPAGERTAGRPGQLLDRTFDPRLADAPLLLLLSCFLMRRSQFGLRAHRRGHVLRRRSRGGGSTKGVSVFKPCC